MTVSDIIEIAIAVLCVVAYALMFYFKTKGGVTAMISELIAEAERTGLTGPEKMEQVVEILYYRVPTVLKSVFTKNMLQNLAQWIFDNMKAFADERYKINSEDKSTDE